MSEYTCKFIGRLKNAIGRAYPCAVTVNAADMNDARHKLYDTHEHISGLQIVGEYQGWTNSKTWSAAYLVQQEFKAYQALTAISKMRPVTGDDVMHAFKLRQLDNRRY